MCEINFYFLIQLFMNKKHLKIALLSLMCTSMALSYTACKDYDDDIDNLQNQIDGIKVTLGELQTKIESGNVITDVTSTADGIVITLSDNKKYTLTNGKDGASADIWTIGADGYWYKNNTKTEYKAIGTDGATGATGATGSQGPQGNPGKDGDTIYYYPNPETGMFDKYENGKKVESTNIPWRTNDKSGGMTATLAGTRLTLAGFDANDPEKTVVINSGVNVGSVALVPSIVCKDLPYATTDKPFYHIGAYLSEQKYNATTKEFIPQTAWDKSNMVDLLYRVNPTGATVTEKDKVGFVNRGVESRADVPGDFTTLLTEKAHAYTDGQLTVTSLYNQSKAIAGKHDIVAAQLWQGQDPYVSDYIAVNSTAISADIVNPKSNPKYAGYYPRKYAITNGESDAFVKSNVTLADAANLPFVYNSGSLNLNEYVELYCKSLASTLTDLNFDGISYKFTLPAEYLANDAQKTNQQWFVSLADGVLSLNAENLGTGTTAAIGRTPVVRVDAFMADNAGTEQMVASAYIKIEITPAGAGPDQPDKDNKLIPMGSKEYNYSQLTDNMMMVDQMPWTDVNTKIYGAEGLTSQNFWSAANYGTNGGKNYTVTIAVQKNGKDVDPLTLGAPVAQVATVDVPFTSNVPGIGATVLFGSGNTQTSNIKFEINNLAKTDITYDNVDGKGAKYTVTITLPSNNLKVHPNIVITKVIYVLNDYQPYKANPNYEVTPGNAGVDITVATKGVPNSTTGVWEMKMNIKEAFRRVNGKDITEYYADNNNVKTNPAIEFGLAPASQPGFNYTPYDVFRTAAMQNATETAHMQYTVTLKNDEVMNRKFDVNFLNPFKSGNPAAINLPGNKIGGATAEGAPSVIVVDLNGDDIYKWNATNNALELTSVATTDYLLSASITSVKYAFDTTSGNYADFKSQLVTGSKFDVDEDTGVIIFDNLGAQLQREGKVNLIATVTFKDLSVVKVVIPVTVTTAAK